MTQEEYRSELAVAMIRREAAELRTVAARWTPRPCPPRPTR